MGQNIIPIGIPSSALPAAGGTQAVPPQEPVGVQVSGVAGGQGAQAVGHESQAGPAAHAPEPDAAPMVGLLIERDEASGGYIYKTVDRMTGEVLRQLPREDVLELRRAQHYSPGRVIDTEA